MAIVVLGKDDSQEPEGDSEPRRRAPSEFGRVAPPDVKLPEGEACEGPRPREVPKQCRDYGVGHRAKEPVEQYRRIG